MNYFEFCDVMNKRNASPVEQLASNVNRLLGIIEAQNERIDMLTDVVYKLAPDIEIIETMAESPEEEADMIARYMNHGRYTE